MTAPTQICEPCQGSGTQRRLLPGRGTVTRRIHDPENPENYIDMPIGEVTKLSATIECPHCKGIGRVSAQ